MNLLAELRSRFEPVLSSRGVDPAAYLAMLKPAQDAKFGDYQANFCMPLAKQLGQAPRELAASLVAQTDLTDLCDPPEIAGPGFINLRIRADVLQRAATQLISDGRLGVAAAAKPRTIVVDFSAPNVAKPMHIGHLRSTVIGDALYRILQFLGHRVIGDNHIGDWGTQFGMIIYGYKNFLNAEKFAEAPVPELARLYRLVNQLSKYHDVRKVLPELEQLLDSGKSRLKALEAEPAPTDKKLQEVRKKTLRQLHGDVQGFEEQLASARTIIAEVESQSALRELAARDPEIALHARQETARLHADDPENLQLWRQFVPQCLAAIQSVYDRLAIHFDCALGESFYNPLLAEVVADLQRQGLATVSDGAVCVFIPGNEAPFIIKKTDGAYTYATTDLATIKYRIQEFHADAILYVVDARQSEHFKLLFETARRWGYQDIELKHVSFGTILGKNKRPFQTRSGDTVGLESVLDEAVAEARQIVNASDNAKPSGPELDDAARQRIAEAVGIGAIKYSDLSQNRESDYEFSYERMLATTGDTATYMQYAYARVCGIFRRGGIDREQLRRTGGELHWSASAERALVVQLLQFSEVLEAAVADYRPNYLTQYLFATANAFSTFFEQCPVLKAETPALRTSRLLLADCTARIIAQGLQLLGIQTLEQM